MQDTLRACEIISEDEEAYSKEEEAGGSRHGHCNELLDELELREVSILRHMAKKCADPSELREKVRKLDWVVEKKNM